VIRRHTISFKHSLDGLVFAFTNHPNLRVHLLAAILAISAGIYFHLNNLEWVILLFTITLVIVAEMINTSIESVVDLLVSEHRLSAKIAKDVSAGMVLLTSILAIIIGIILFIPKIF
jgi:undecaprenol kinase